MIHRRRSAFEHRLRTKAVYRPGNEMTAGEFHRTLCNRALFHEVCGSPDFAVYSHSLLQLPGVEAQEIA